MSSLPISKNDVNIEVDKVRGHEPPRKGFVEYRIVSLVRIGETCSRIVTWRRYSEFFRLRSLLLKEYGSKNVEPIIFPPKSLIGKYDPVQLESRRRCLHLFMNRCVETLPGVGRVPDFASFLRGSDENISSIYDRRSAQVTLTPRFHSLWHLRRGPGSFGVSHVASSLKQMRISPELLEMDLHVQIVSIEGDVTSLASLLLNVNVFPDFSARKLVASPLCAGVSAVVSGVTEFESSTKSRGTSRWCISSVQDKRYETTRFTKHRSEMIVQLWESESMEGQSDAIKLNELPVRVNKKNQDSRRFHLTSSRDEKSEWSVEIETWLQLSSKAMTSFSQILKKENTSFSDPNQYARYVASALLKDCASDALRIESSRIDLLKSSRPFRFAEGVMSVTCTSSSNSAAACRVMDKTSQTEWSATSRSSQWICLSWKRAHHLTGVHLLWSKPPSTFQVEVSSDGKSWQVFSVPKQFVEASCLNGGWTSVNGVSKSPALLVRHVKILCLSRGRFSEYGLIRVCPMGVPSSSKRNRWLARQASECQRSASRIASVIARGHTGALYDRRVVLSSRNDDVFIKNQEEQQLSPIHTEMRRCLETSSSLDSCWPRFVLEWDWMTSKERATLVRGMCAVSWRSAERAIMLDRPRKHQDTFCPMLRIITTSVCFALRVLANVNTVAIRGYVRVKRQNAELNIPRPDIVLSFFSVVHSWILPLLEDVATGLSGTCGLQNAEMAGTKAHRDLVQLCTDYISVLRTLRWTTTIMGEFSSSRGDNDEKDVEDDVLLFEDEDRQRRLRVLFGDLDRLRTGYIDRTTIHSVMNTLSEPGDQPLSNKMISKMLQHADGDGDGRVNFEDFESSLMRDNASSNMTNSKGDDPVRIFRVSTRDVQRVQRRLIAAYARDAESKAVRTVTKWVRSLMLGADDMAETHNDSVMSKYEVSLREVEDKILGESENGSNYELATSLVRGYARAAMEFARIVSSIMSSKRCTQQALLRTANCSFSLHSRFVKLIKQVKSSYSALEKGKQDKNSTSSGQEEWGERSGFVRAGNFVLSHFISTAFVKTGLTGEKGLFTSTDGRKSLFSLPLSDSSILAGPLTALGAFLSALKPPTLDPKAYGRLLTSAARLLCASYIRALRQLRNEDRPIGHGYEFSSSDICRDSTSTFQEFDICSSLGPLVQDLQSKFKEIAEKNNNTISKAAIIALLKNLACLRLCVLNDIKTSLEPFVSASTENVDYVAFCRWLRRHHTVSLGGMKSRRTIREDQQKIIQLFANVILHLDTHASPKNKNIDSATFDSYVMARSIAHELNPLQVLITMLTCPLPHVVSSDISTMNGQNTRKSKRFRMSQRLVGNVLCCGHVYKRSKWIHQWRKRYCIVRVNRGQEYQIAFFRSVEDADLAMAGKKISTSRVYVLPAGTVVEVQSTVLPSGIMEEQEEEQEEESDEEKNHTKCGDAMTWFGISLKLPTQEMFLAFTSQSEQEKWFEAIQQASSNAIAHVVAAVTLSSSLEEKKENMNLVSSSPVAVAPVLDELCLGLALLRPRPKPLAILKAIRLCLKLRGSLSKTLRVSIEKACRQRLQDGLGAHSLIVAANKEYDEGEDDEDEDVKEDDEEETNASSSFNSHSIDMERNVYDWIFFSPLTTTTTTAAISTNGTKESSPKIPSQTTHEMFLTSILWKRSDFWKTWKRRVVVFRSGVGKNDKVSYWRKSNVEGNLEKAVRENLLGSPDGTYIIKGYRSLPVEQRPEKNRPSGEADVFPFEIAILESSKSKHEVTTMRLATDTMSQRAEWATAIQQATIFRRTKSIVSVPSSTDVVKNIDDEESSNDEDLEDVNIATLLRESSVRDKKKNLPDMYNVARFYENIFAFVRENTLRKMTTTTTSSSENVTLMSRALNFLDSLGGPESSSGKEFLRFFANENLREYKIRFHVDDQGRVKVSEADLKNLDKRFDWFHNLLIKFDECLKTKWLVPSIWHHALLEDMCKAFCLMTRTHVFNLLEDDSDLALVIQALRATSRFEQTLVRELHRRQILGADISKRIESKNSNESERKEERNAISGILLKQSRWLLQWRRRSFVLRGRRLTVYHDCEKEIRDLLESEPDDVFALRPGTVSVVADDTTQCILEDKTQWFVMRLKISRTEMILAAPTERERLKWIKSFRRVSLWKKSKQLREASSSNDSTRKIHKRSSSQLKSHETNEDDEEMMTTSLKVSSEFDPQNMISSVFEPHILRFVRIGVILLRKYIFHTQNNQVRVEEEALHKVLLGITSSASSRPEEFVELNVHKTILASALDLTGNGFKRVLTHCTAVANGRVFWRLHRCFKDCLTKYGNFLLFVKLISGGGGDNVSALQRMSSTPRNSTSTSRFSSSSVTPKMSPSIPLDTKTRHVTCCVANTAAYLIMTIPGLEDAFQDHMEDAYADHVDMSSEMEHLYGIVNHAVRRLKDDVLRQLRPVILRFRDSNSKARRSLFPSSSSNEKTSSSSSEILQVTKVLLSTCPTIQDELSPLNYKRFCEILATSLVREYVRAVLRMSLLPTETSTRVSPIDGEAVKHMKRDLEDLIRVMKRLPKSKYTSISSPGNITDTSEETFDEKKLEHMYASFFSVLKMTRSNMMRIFAVLDVNVSLENFRDTVAAVWKDAMPSALPGSVTPSLLPADELQSVLRLKGASEDESTVIMAELGLQYNKRLPLRRSASARLSMFQSPWGGSTPL